MNQNLLYIKIKVALAELKINEVYNASEYLAQVILFLIVNHDDSKPSFKRAVEDVGLNNNISSSTITISIAKLLKACNLKQYPEIYAFGDLYKKVVCLKNILQFKIDA